jgi:glycosyltransferase involved in cell wall biosynthesis
MVLYGDITFDGRVQREANSLVEAGHSVTVFCTEGSHAAAPMLDPRVDLAVVRTRRRPESPDASSVNATRRGLRRNAARLAFLAAYARNLRTWALAISRTSLTFDVWHAHDFTGLVAASMVRPADASLVYDMHDLFLESGAGARLPGPLRRLLGWYERRLVRSAVLLVTVNEGLAAYAREHRRPRSIAVVHNCVPAWPAPDPLPTLIRDAVGLVPAQPVVLYHGLLGGDRGLDTLLRAMLEPGLERAHLVLMGFGPDRDRLCDLAAEPRFGQRIHVLDAVAPSDLLPWVASADVGVMPNQPRTLNERLSTPNKLFESIGAGLPVVSSDFPERRRIIMDDPLGPLGAVCDPTDPAALGRAIRSILDLDPESRIDLRRRCSEAARLRWNWEAEAQSLLEGYRRAAGS